jgi:hypothetical protein
MTQERVHQLLDSVEWKFAKTMPWIPHFYTLKMKWTDQEDFYNVVRYLRAYSVTETFGKKQYDYYYYNGYKYWTMGAPVADTILINRAKAQC